MSKKREKVIEGPFVWVLKDTLNCPAWKAMSPEARLLYIAVKGRLSNDAKNNGRVYLATRTAAEQLGLNQKTIMRCYRELQHYGFLVQTEGASLGVEGRGKAARWRLPELPCWVAGAKERATRDYERWDGVQFAEPSRWKPSAKRQYGRWKNKIPHPTTDHTGPHNGSPVDPTTDHLNPEVIPTTDHIAAADRSPQRTISRVATGDGAGGSEKVEADPLSDAAIGRNQGPPLVPEPAADGGPLGTLTAEDRGDRQ